MWRARIFRNGSVTSQITSSHASNFPEQWHIVFFT